MNDTTMMGLRNALVIVEMMIDRLNRELYSNGSMMGAVNSAYEALTPDEKKNYDLKRKQLSNLVAYKTELLNAALEEFSTNNTLVEEPLTVAEDGEGHEFDFSL